MSYCTYTFEFKRQYMHFQPVLPVALITENPHRLLSPFSHDPLVRQIRSKQSIKKVCVTCFSFSFLVYSGHHVTQRPDLIPPSQIVTQHHKKTLNPVRLQLVGAAGRDSWVHWMCISVAFPWVLGPAHTHTHTLSPIDTRRL